MLILGSAATVKSAAMRPVSPAGHTPLSACSDNNTLHAAGRGGGTHLRAIISSAHLSDAVCGLWQRLVPRGEASSVVGSDDGVAECAEGRWWLEG